ncbi:hypothetical protein CWI36_0226p0010 [Hamiltosporidium magnivora]|uniref:Uncharacterized protein n=1 Tax=Hamiltosporidium magnivora TaxID=148818 RepID=A0A4Q9LI14_9MICR|nr:hypothetical protein CWI36_0246p0010 [Hamiltosporidium magnivora]TBU07789.1 hypothetical protein CWI36_0226p0010 [Hamiltosporidium magnivora]
MAKPPSSPSIVDSFTLSGSQNDSSKGYFVSPTQNNNPKNQIFQANSDSDMIEK